MNVTKYFKLLLFTAFLVLQLGCWNEHSFKIALSEIETVQIPANPNAHAFKLTLKGELSCDVQLILLKNDEPSYKFNFSGKIDTIIRKEWYHQALAFKLVDQGCNIENNVYVKFKLLTI